MARRGKLGFAMLFTTGVLWLAPLAKADPCYLRYDADGVFPEEAGWTRFYDDGAGESRSIDQGVLTLDTLASRDIFDLYEVSDEALTPNAGEEFSLSWRMQTTAQDASFPKSDVAVGVINSEHSYAILYIGSDFVTEDRFLAGFTELAASFAPDVAHTFRFLTRDMETYSLFVDGQPAFTGEFHDYAWRDVPRVSWGDAFVGYASLSQWDFVEVAVTPEPPSVLAVAACLLLRKRFR